MAKKDIEVTVDNIIDQYQQGAITLYEFCHKMAWHSVNSAEQIQALHHQYDEQIAQEDAAAGREPIEKLLEALAEDPTAKVIRLSADSNVDAILDEIFGPVEEEIKTILPPEPHRAVLRTLNYTTDKGVVLPMLHGGEYSVGEAFIIDINDKRSHRRPMKHNSTNEMHDIAWVWSLRLKDGSEGHIAVQLLDVDPLPLTNTPLVVQ